MWAIAKIKNNNICIFENEMKKTGKRYKDLPACYKGRKILKKQT